jgi:RNA polymerase sigma-70 factor (ECF subfamily)
MHRRAQSRRREDGLDRASGHHAGDDMAAEVEHASEHAGLRAAVRALPEPLRHVLLLRLVDDFAHEEVASTLGISVANSRTRLARAIDALRRALGSDAISSTTRK